MPWSGSPTARPPASCSPFAGHRPTCGPCERPTGAEWDALDRLADSPAADETITAYRRQGKAAACHLLMSPRSASGWYAFAEYADCDPQPADEVMRSAEQWRAWCVRQAADIARAAEIYARRQRLSEDAIAYATAIKIDAMTLMGEMLKAGPKNQGAVPGKTGSKGVPVLDPKPTLADFGISKKESSQAQTLADLKAAKKRLGAIAKPSAFQGGWTWRLAEQPLETIPE